MSWKRNRSAQAKEIELDGPILLGKPPFLTPSTSSGCFFLSPSSFSDYRVLEGKQIWFYLSRLVWIARWRWLQWALLLSWSGSVNNSLDLPSCPLWLWPLLYWCFCWACRNKQNVCLCLFLIGCWVLQNHISSGDIWKFLTVKTYLKLAWNENVYTEISTVHDLDLVFIKLPVYWFYKINKLDFIMHTSTKTWQ